MKGKQKILALMLAVMMLITCLAACGKESGTTESSGSDGKKETEQTSDSGSSEKESGSEADSADNGGSSDQGGAIDDEPLALKDGNIFKNPFFADGDQNWTEEVGKSKISSVTADKPLFAGSDIKTYGVIERDPENSSQFDCFAQDITEVVDNDKMYEFEFYVMLSDDYKDASDEMSTVAFAPFYTLDGETSYLGTYSTWEISGESSLVCKPGEWTKFSGTFQLGCEKKPERVVVRILEQGYDYQDADSCIKGTYYVTGLCLRDIDED